MAPKRSARPKSKKITMKLEPIDESLKRICPWLPKEKLMKWRKYFDGLEKLKKAGHDIATKYPANYNEMSNEEKLTWSAENRNPLVTKLYNKTLRNWDAWKEVEERERIERQVSTESRRTAEELLEDLNRIRERDAQRREKEMQMERIRDPAVVVEVKEKVLDVEKIEIS